MKSFKIISIFLLCVASAISTLAQPISDFRWTTFDTNDSPTGRHENSFVEYNEKFYLLGGRGINPVDVYDPKTNTWEAKSKSPIQIHHFQAVVYNNAIYLIGAMTDGYPKEPALANIWIYYPETDKWVKGPEIPEARRRGGAGTVIYNDKIYMACGIKIGHTSGTNNYFDSYDLKTGEWKVLTDAPHIRDHVPAIVVDDKLWLVGGRNTSVHFEDNFGAFFNAVEPHVDYYDFKKEQWFTLKENLPIPTAAGSLVNIGKKLLYIGGEGPQAQAYNNTQCLDLETGKWSQMATLCTGRHGTGAVVYDNKIYTVAGSPVKGGGELTSLEVFAANHQWQSLFNGKDLEGWDIKCVEAERDKKFWYVENGLLVCNSMGSKNHSYIWLQSKNEYADFELRFKFQSTRQNIGNSGIQIRSRWSDNRLASDVNTQPGWMDGPQIDIDPKNSWRNGFIYDETTEVRHWINPVLPDWKIDKEKYAPKKVIHYFEDEQSGWNDMTIVCKGTRIKTYANNILVSDFDGTGVLNDEIHKKYNVGMKGHLAFQLHMKGENYLRFKDIEIREIK